MSSFWNDENDLDDDLMALAELDVPFSKSKDNDVKVPDSILKYRQQQRKNGALKDYEIDEGNIFIVSGRGRGVKDRFIRPGEIVTSTREDEIELTNRIRQIQGLGYSNEISEKFIKATRESNKQEPSTSALSLIPKFEWTASPPGTSSTSSTSVPETDTSPGEETPDKEHPQSQQRQKFPKRKSGKTRWKQLNLES